MNNFEVEIISKLRGSKCAAVFCHARPDGDALGSGLGLVLALRLAGKVAHMYCEDAVPEKFLYVPAMSEVKCKLSDCEYDTLISVDCADSARLGVFAGYYTKFKGATVNIDHHISNQGYAKYNYVRECPASCELITALLREGDFEINEEIANLLMLGLITDSGNFTHNDVSPKTFETAAYLRGKGANVNEINYNMFTRQPKNRALLYGNVMSKMRFALDDRLAIIVITSADFEKFGAEKSLTEGFVDFPLTVDGVEVAAAVMEFKAGQYKVSLRSKGRVNVNGVAVSFGGGGHILASGCMIFGELEEVIDRLTYAIYQHI